MCILKEMKSRCECVVKRTGKVCAKPTTGFNSQGTPVCGLHTGRSRRLVNVPPSLPIKKIIPPPALKQFLVVFKNNVSTQTKLVRFPKNDFCMSVLSWIVVLTTILLLSTPPPQPTSWSVLCY